MHRRIIFKILFYIYIYFFLIYLMYHISVPWLPFSIVNVCLHNLRILNLFTSVLFIRRSVYLVFPATQIVMTAGTTVDKGTHPIINIRHN